MTLTEEAQDKGFSWSVVILAGLLLGVTGAFAYYIKNNPCPCGEKQVDEVAKASAEIAETNGKTPIKKAAPKDA